MTSFLHDKPGLFGISFDGVPMSGVIVEFIKMTSVFHKHQYNIYLDLGYEIKVDKNNFYKPFCAEKKLFPAWVRLVKVLPAPFLQYSRIFVANVFKNFIQSNSQDAHLHATINTYADKISEKMLILWRKLNIKVVIVENGTLPENVIFTKALYKAIEIYGSENKLEKFVIWRDHDLMWSSEFGDAKYGKAPYLNVPKPKPSPYISHVVLHHADYLEMQKWNPETPVHVLKNSFELKQLSMAQANSDWRNNFRKHYHVPEHAHLIARFTRIIPQKRIDRDIYLLHALHRLQVKLNLIPNIYLCIAGNPNENGKEYSDLCALIQRFNLSNYVVFTGTLKPFAVDNDVATVPALISAADVCSFLTSFDYESFGNPIAEAISFNKPYIATSYQRYEHVYGAMGYQGVLLLINAADDGRIEGEFTEKVYTLLCDDKYRASLTKHNYSLMFAHNKSHKSLKQYVSELLAINFD